MRLRTLVHRLKTAGRPASRLTHTRRLCLDALPKRSVGAEVGVWQGDLSAAILAVVKPSRLYLIDPWRFVPEYPSSLYGGNAAMSQSDMDEIHEAVVRRFRRDPRVTVLRETSADAASRVEPLDWVYVDGDHTYEAVRRDLELYGARLKPGGVLCGDDYSDGGWWGDGVIRAVDEFVAERDLELELMGEQWLIRLP